MFIIFDLQLVDTNEASQVHELLLANQIQYQEHHISEVAFSQHYLWVKDEHTYIKARKLIDDFYRDSPDFKQISEQDYGSINKWYLVMIALFALVYITVMILDHR